MKILANVNNCRFIAELTFEEIDLLAGKKIGQDKGYCGTERGIAAGTTFNITKAFEQIYRNKARKAEIETVRRTLEGVINTLDIIEPFIGEPEIETPKPVSTAE